MPLTMLVLCMAAAVILTGCDNGTSAPRTIAAMYQGTYNIITYEGNSSDAAASVATIVVGSGTITVTGTGGSLASGPKILRGVYTEGGRSLDANYHAEKYAYLYQNGVKIGYVLKDTTNNFYLYVGQSAIDETFSSGWDSFVHPVVSGISPYPNIKARR